MRKTNHGNRGLATALPKARFHITNAPRWYATKKKAVVVHHVSDDQVVAVLEILSPGNKCSGTALKASVTKAQDLLYAGVHLNLVDLLPPGSRDPEGIHPLVWGDDDFDTFEFVPTKPLTAPGISAGSGPRRLWSL